MGKARILEVHGEGRYTIEIIEARERAEAAKQQAQARITQLTAEISALNQQIAAAQSEADSAAAAQNAAINQYQQEMVEAGESSVDLEEFATQLLEAAAKRDALRTEQQGKQLRIAADQALIARVDSLPPLRQMQAWCADYTEDLSGEVATAEAPGEIGNVIIKPGFEGANQWSATEDGAMQPALASTPAGTFYNLAMQPGWQKWRPTYRTATITTIDGDTCSIALDAATSSQQALSVNARSSYSGVPILYMDCNGAAFEQGDKVLVAFAGNVEGPTVVGFEQEPRECELAYAVHYFYVNNADSGFLGTYPEREAGDGDFSGYIQANEVRTGTYVERYPEAGVEQYPFSVTNPPRVFNSSVRAASFYAYNFQAELNLTARKDEQGIISRNVFKAEVSVPRSDFSVQNGFSGFTWFREGYLYGPVIESGGGISGSATATLTPSTMVNLTNEITLGGLDIQIRRQAGFNGLFTLSLTRNWGAQGNSLFNFHDTNYVSSLQQMGLSTYPFSETIDDLYIEGLRIDVQSVLLHLNSDQANYHANPAMSGGNFNQSWPSSYQCKIIILREKRAEFKLLIGVVVLKNNVNVEPLVGVSVKRNADGQIQAQRAEVSPEDYSLYLSETGGSQSVVRLIAPSVG